MKTWRTWTANEIRRLEELRLQGYSAFGISVELGRTVRRSADEVSELIGGSRYSTWHARSGAFARGRGHERAPPSGPCGLS